MRIRRMTGAKVHDATKGTYYTISDPSQCRDKTDKSAAVEAWKLEDVITMGCVIIEPLWEYTDEG